MKTTILCGLGVLALAAAGCGTTAMNAGPDRPMDRAAMDRTLAGWSPASRMAFQATLASYGAPDEMTPTMAVWHDNGPWKRTTISATATPHRFPGPHDDVMEQVVDYRVPPDRFDELAAYDGSVIVERTKGELSARCDLEGANFLALNLAHQIVSGERTVEEARAEYARQITAMKAGQPAPLTERLTFTPMPNAADPDVPAPSMAGG